MSPLSSESIAFQSSFCQALPKTTLIAFSFLSENGDSVIVPIRIDVDGAIEPYNSVNSVFDAYNPAYVADLLRDENIRYTRNNKSVEELLSNRRQVPAATRSVDASDTEGLLSSGREVPPRLAPLMSITPYHRKAFASRSTLRIYTSPPHMLSIFSH